MELLNIDSPRQVVRDVKVGRDVKLWNWVNLYGCEIGDESMIGTFCEIQAGVVIGKRCRVQSHSFLCEGVTLEDEVFVGHGVMFINDSRPSNSAGHRATWKAEPVLVREGAAIGSGAVILGGVTIGRRALVGAGAVVTRDVPDSTTVTGVPAGEVVTRMDLVMRPH